MQIDTFFTPGRSTKFRFPLFSCPISAGLPASVDDYIEGEFELENLMKHPDNTVFLRVAGDSMARACIRDRDMLMVDRAVEPMDGDVAIAVLNGELTVKRLKWENGLVLVAENPSYKPIFVNANDDFHIWGVATNVLHRLGRGTKPLGRFSA
jgi:DNA polymerase V